MGRILFLVLIAVLFFLLIRSFTRSLKKKREEIEKTQRSLEGEDMVRCVHCGVHLPRSESIISEGKFFCSDEHRRLHAKP
jgi:uncharacterized protein